LCLADVLLVSHNRKLKPLAWEGVNNIPPEERSGCDARLTTEPTLAALRANRPNRKVHRSPANLWHEELAAAERPTKKKAVA
jgi:hypothetical protein